MTDRIDEGNLDPTSSTENVKKQRRRKKKLYKTIREQMEFYFSDSNLSKDKFMQELMAQSADGFIDLDLFATFNKIRSMTQDVSEIAQALWFSSDLLELNEEHTKVRRTTAVQPREDVDDCTIYVEHLPKHVNHAWLKRIFSSYGLVTYISLPRYKSSGQPKGFAFVEFDTPTAARRACEHLGNFSEDTLAMKITSEQAEELHSMTLEQDNKLESLDIQELVSMPPPVLDSQERKLTKRKHEPEEDEDRLVKKRGESCDDGEKPEFSPPTEQELVSVQPQVLDSQERKLTKRKHEPEEDEDRLVKKTRESSDDDKKPEFTPPTVQVSSTAAEGTEGNLAPSCADESRHDDINQVTSGKKKRKRQKKSKEKLEQETLQLRVLSKCEWKRLKNRYLALQKANMSYLKRSLGCVMDPSPSLRAQNYGVVNPGDKSSTEAAVPTKKLEFQAHVVVKLTLTSSISNPKQLIEEIKSTAGIDYVEAKLGESTVFVRCHSAFNAQLFMKSMFVTTKVQEARLLEGDEEVQYWGKIQKDREENRLRTSKVKVRGREKLLARANKAVEKSRHIYFDD